MLRKKYQRVGKTAFFGCLALVVLLGVVPSLIREDYTSYAPSSSGQATSHQKLVNQFADDPGLQLPRLIESMDNRNVDISALRIAILEHTDWHDGESSYSAGLARSPLMSIHTDYRRGDWSCGTYTARAGIRI